ncbi:MAG: Tritrans,polycis-undecaprenyl-diphosphate synthase (geranylgeranyl-diphosphate specific) [Candidatus Wolfebacteria bacterium GW2011_GWE2_44_13]|uniref:Isoprenyl transferase n=1 Tax=Candidatus Wolfebacteria bacterium GW2011_GWE2_44_13 TaxID=1619017 RepID=A0A0G1H8Z5_9BACT|nr:MAG: Tritrans,polycis-undecaprenyl-diphosphate synthase (geranylgeranyl-diphosphate specific) [Candidatus Wolfebacteria bacterium GW2011_GWE2_44_13]
MNIPKHIAVIPDGNRRWAREKSLPDFFGHREGAKRIVDITKQAINGNVYAITFWGLSLDNIEKRKSTEINFIYKILESNFKKLAKNRDIHKNKVKINVIGRWRQGFPKSLIEKIEEAIDATKGYGDHQLTFLLAYNGIDEMMNGIKEIAKAKRKNDKLEINEELVKKNLWTSGLPPVDLVIRTGGEPHWSSGFMMWDIANAHFYFTKILWPDFSEREFEKALNYFASTDRRMGK